MHFILLYSTLIFPFFCFQNLNDSWMWILTWLYSCGILLVSWQFFFHILTRRKWTFEQRIIYLTFYLQYLIINFTSSAILLAISKRSTLHHLTSHLSPYPFIPPPWVNLYTSPLPCPALHLSWSVSHAGFVRVSTCKKQVSVNSYLT